MELLPISLFVFFCLWQHLHLPRMWNTYCGWLHLQSSGRRRPQYGCSVGMEEVSALIHSLLMLRQTSREDFWERLEMILAKGTELIKCRSRTREEKFSTFRALWVTWTIWIFSSKLDILSSKASCLVDISDTISYTVFCVWRREIIFSLRFLGANA